MKVAPKPPRKRSEDDDLTPFVIAALNKLPGVRVRRNVSKAVPAAWGGYVRVGLGEGSPDIVGIVRRVIDGVSVGQAFTLEMKWSDASPNQHGAEGHEENQRRWQRAFVACGGYHETIRAKSASDAIEKATAAVSRCRGGRLP
jgi:hypothetical protein